MYRSRLDADIDEITLDYVSSINDDEEIIQYDILGSQAHAIMLYDNNIITRTDVKKILLALESLKSEKLESTEAEDIHELIERRVIQVAGMESGGKMHTARSRNDQIASDMRMKIRDDIRIVSKCLYDVIEELVSLAEEHKKTIMPLYTHLQQAQVGLFSHYLIAQADALFRDSERIYEVYNRANENPLGSGPVGGTSIPIKRIDTGKLLGFSRTLENSFDATSTRDFAAEYVSMIAVLMTNLSRIAEDFVIWSTTEFSFIELADEFASPSSVMPQKKNPDMLELTRGKTAQVIGNLTTILSAIKGLASGYGRDLQQIKPAVWSSSKTAISALLVMKSILQNLQVNDKNMKKAAEKGYLVALDVAEELVLNNVPFRLAHKISGELVKTAHKQNKQLHKLTLKEIAQTARDTRTDPELILQIVKEATIVKSLRRRTSFGGAGYKQQNEMIELRKRNLRTYKRACNVLDKDSKDMSTYHTSRVQQLIS